MYRFVPQKKRSRLRVKAGVVFYCLLRYFYWIRYGKNFSARNKKTSQDLVKEFPYIVFSHESPLRRNLSEIDTELQEGKVANLKLAAECVSPVVLDKGKVFSYWHLIGNPTRMRGFKTGMMLVNGKPSSAVGGGLCALSNLIYWMTLHTPLVVAERFRHSYDVFPDSNRTLPFGSGATCVYNYRDLMILNDTDQEYFLNVWVDEAAGKLKGEWRTRFPVKDKYEIYEKDHWITHEISNVYVRHNTLWRKHFVESDGKLVFDREEQITENHALMMYEPLLEGTPQEK